MHGLSAPLHIRVLAGRAAIEAPHRRDGDELNLYRHCTHVERPCRARQLPEGPRAAPPEERGRHDGGPRSGGRGKQRRNDHDVHPRSGRLCSAGARVRIWSYTAVTVLYTQ